MEHNSDNVLQSVRKSKNCYLCLSIMDGIFFFDHLLGLYMEGVSCNPHNHEQVYMILHTYSQACACTYLLIDCWGSILTKISSHFLSSLTCVVRPSMCQLNKI